MQSDAFAQAETPGAREMLGPRFAAFAMAVRPWRDLTERLSQAVRREDAGASENLETRPVAPASPWSSGVAARLGHVRRGDLSSGVLVGHCHDRNRSFDLAPCLAALVRA